MGGAAGQGRGAAGSTSVTMSPPPWRTARDALWQAPCDLDAAEAALAHVAALAAIRPRCRRRSTTEGHSMTPCGRPGCAGSIVDGYCDTCGLAPAKRTGAAAAAGADPASGRTSARFDVTRLTNRVRRGTGSSRRRSRVGAGVVEVAPVSTVDPAAVVMADPSVPEDRRFCTNCDAPVGRGKDGRPGRQAGFCPRCGARFDFAAKLADGRARGRAVRGGRAPSPTAAWAGSTSPATATCRAGGAS